MRHPQVPVQIQDAQVKLLQDLYRLVRAAPHSSVQNRACKTLYAKKVFTLLKKRYGIPDMTWGRGLSTEIQLAIQAEIPAGRLVDMFAAAIELKRVG